MSNSRIRSPFWFSVTGACVPKQSAAILPTRALKSPKNQTQLTTRYSIQAVVHLHVKSVRFVRGSHFTRCMKDKDMQHPSNSVTRYCSHDHLSNKQSWTDTFGAFHGFCVMFLDPQLHTVMMLARHSSRVEDCVSIRPQNLRLRQSVLLHPNDIEVSIGEKVIQVQPRGLSCSGLWFHMYAPWQLHCQRRQM